jgi:photosystem II stability/assembly factor-like uncharacterized protein
MNPSKVVRRNLISVAMAMVFALLSATVVSSRSGRPALRTDTASPESTPAGIHSPSPADCRPGSGWMWARGPSQPDVAGQVRDGLDRIGIVALVEATGFGETDSCGEFILHAVDFDITVLSYPSDGMDDEELAERIQSISAQFARPDLGNVRLALPEGDTVVLRKSEVGEAWSYDAPTSPPSGEILNRKVYVVVYDPILGSGQKLSTHLGWNDHATLTQGTVNLFRQASNDRVRYDVVYTTEKTDGWPELVDGFRYTEEEYLAVLDGQHPPHEPQGVDYNKIVNATDLDICGKVNRGEIDEVWIYNGPYFGFYESRLVGPGAYWYNSPPVPEPYDCNRLVPIMGPSPERGVAEAVHNFGHRTESTMLQVYGSWVPNRTAHNWERFALVKAKSPAYSYSGCGDTHFPPNGTSDYDYGNTSTVLSNCDDFANYPDLGDPSVTAQPVTCWAWNCDHHDYLAYWFGHFPRNVGCGPDDVANDWWQYFVEPALALNPSSPCHQFHLHLPQICRRCQSHLEGWTKQDSGTTRFLKDLSFVDDTRGWVVGQGGIILHTSNGGSVWSQQSSGVTTDLEGVHCIDSLRCWAVGDSGTILETGDGGQHWSKLTSGTTSDLDGVQFVTAQIGWAVGNGGTIRKTLDGGAHWDSQTSGTSFWLWGIHFLDQNRGWVSGGSGSGVILRTSDGGATWTPAATSNEIADVFFVDTLEGWAVTNAATKILHSLDGGVSWSAVTPPSAVGWLTSLHFVASQEGWVAGAGGVILHTVDGGAHWNPVETGVSAIVQSIFFPSADVGWAVGELGTVLKYGE